MSRVPRALLLVLVPLVLMLPLAKAKKAEPALDRAANVRLGDKVSPLLAAGSLRPDQQYVGGCGFFSGKALPHGVSVMVSDGAVVRFDISAYELGTGNPSRAGPGPFGIRIGDSEADTLNKLPRGVQVSQHEYGGPGDHYLTWYDKARRLAIRAETFAGKVNQLQWGQPDAVELIEGCS